LVPEILHFPWAAIAEVMGSEPLPSKILSKLTEHWTAATPVVTQEKLPYQ